MENHKYTLSDLMNMMPWEREIYLTMLINQMKEQQTQAEQR